MGVENVALVKFFYEDGDIVTRKLVIVSEGDALFAFFQSSGTSANVFRTPGMFLEVYGILPIRVKEGPEVAHFPMMKDGDLVRHFQKIDCHHLWPEIFVVKFGGHRGGLPEWASNLIRRARLSGKTKDFAAYVLDRFYDKETAQLSARLNPTPWNAISPALYIALVGRRRSLVIPKASTVLLNPIRVNEWLEENGLGPVPKLRRWENIRGMKRTMATLEEDCRRSLSHRQRERWAYLRRGGRVLGRFLNRRQRPSPSPPVPSRRRRRSRRLASRRK